MEQAADAISDAGFYFRNNVMVRLTSFNEKGDAIKPIIIKTIKNGQFVYARPKSQNANL